MAFRAFADHDPVPFGWTMILTSTYPLHERLFYHYFSTDNLERRYSSRPKNKLTVVPDSFVMPLIVPCARKRIPLPPFSSPARTASILYYTTLLLLQNRILLLILGTSSSRASTQNAQRANAIDGRPPHARCHVILSSGQQEAVANLESVFVQKPCAAYLSEYSSPLKSHRDS